MRKATCCCPCGKVSLFLLKPARTGAGRAAASVFSEGKSTVLNRRYAIWNLSLSPHYGACFFSSHFHSYLLTVLIFFIFNFFFYSHESQTSHDVLSEGVLSCSASRMGESSWEFSLERLGNNRQRFAELSGVEGAGKGVSVL